ncbi:MAG TPA: helicase HerA-like domain-containing protein [Thermoanaerobaculia bacterium]|nr:helicase HerA-like domain-containing protein [Thermoanaerobaculia bacterium]
MILLGKGNRQVHLLSRYGNRHGMIAGATGTGKTVSLMVLAEGFSRLGVPVFMADVKGDVAGLAMPGASNEKIADRVAQIGIEDYAPEGSPVIFWDLYGDSGHPVRATMSEIGPALLARMLELSDVQSGVLEVVFHVADEEGLLLLDLDDLRSLLSFVSANRKAISAEYGLVNPQSIAAIQRALLTLERNGGRDFFGEPALDLNDLMRTDLNGRGVISVLSAEKLVLKPRLYSSFLLWLLSEIFENLPEAGDLDKPKLVFFFDEAHLLFDDAPPALRERVEQVVRIIRSKGVGVYFCSQFPDDIPGEILGQLGNRIQHALRAYTPRDQKAVRTAAETFPPNEGVDVAAVISSLAVGEALVSTLQEKGVPLPVEKTLMSPPRCRMGTITPEERAIVRGRSPVGGRYDTPLNRESAHELLMKRAASAAPTPPSGQGTARKEETSSRGKVSDVLWGTKRRQGMVETMAKQAARSIGGRLGTAILRGILGGIKRK